VAWRTAERYGARVVRTGARAEGTSERAVPRIRVRAQWRRGAAGRREWYSSRNRVIGKPQAVLAAYPERNARRRAAVYGRYMPQTPGQTARTQRRVAEVACARQQAVTARSAVIRSARTYLARRCGGGSRYGVQVRSKRKARRTGEAGRQ